MDIFLDPLQVKNADGTTVSPSTQDTLGEIASATAAIAGAKGVAADLRTTILSGVVTSVGTLTTITNIGGNPAICYVPNINNTTYVMTNQLNIGIS